MAREGKRHDARGVVVGLAVAAAIGVGGGCGGSNASNAPASPPDPADGATCGGGGGPTGGPADLFPCDSPWYQDVTSAPVASDSDAVIAAIGAWGTGKLRIDFSFHFAHADATTPRHAFQIDDTGDSDSDPVPVPPGYALEGETGLACTQGGDCHLLVVDDAAHKLFELYGVQNAGGPYQATQETVWDLTRHYGPEGRGYGCTSADAAGLAIMTGLIGVREGRAGAIRHALRFILPNAKIRKGPSFVAPASHGTSATSSAQGPAYGMRLRLKASFDAAKVTTPGGRAVVAALQRYGMFLADGGNYALTAEDDALEKKADPTMAWDGVLSGDDLVAIQPTDFDVLDYGAIRNDDNCVLSK
jgi:serine/threonine-protein kinase